MPSNEKERTPKDILGYFNEFLPTAYKGKNLQAIPDDILQTAYDRMMRSTVDPDALTKEMRDRVANLAFVTSGAGPYFNQIQTYLTCLDRFKGNILPINTMESGLTFITRPRLCLQSSNIRNNRRMAALDTLNPTSMAFMIRCLLDTNFGEVNGQRYKNIVNSSPLLDPYNPFMVPLCNSLLSISGFPDMMIQTQTTDGGYQAEAQTFAVGGDDFNRATYNLTLEFKDIQHGPISAIIYYWLEYIRCVTRGILLAYADDIDEQRLNYTVSIYRFALDPTKTYIVDWCKCTGCFPTNLNTGATMQVNDGEEFVTAATRINVGFACNKVEYRDHAIFMDFNTLVQRYFPDINKGIDGKYAQPDEQGVNHSTLRYPNLPKEPYANFRGIPYITSDMHGPRLEFRRSPTPVFPYTRGTNDLVDQLLMIDMMRKAKEFGEENYKRYAEMYTPEYMRQAKGQNLGANIKAFFQRVMNDKTHDSKGFEAIQYRDNTPSRSAQNTQGVN